MANKKLTIEVNESTLNDINESLEDLSNLIQERITENNRTEGVLTKQATHAFMLYRKLIWSVKYSVKYEFKIK